MTDLLLTESYLKRRHVHGAHRYSADALLPTLTGTCWLQAPLWKPTNNLSEVTWTKQAFKLSLRTDLSFLSRQQGFSNFRRALRFCRSWNGSKRESRRVWRACDTRVREQHAHTYMHAYIHQHACMHVSNMRTHMYTNLTHAQKDREWEREP